MGTFSLMHWVIVLFIVVILFGAKRLPQIGQGIGEMISNFKKSTGELEGPPPTAEKREETPPKA